MGNFNSNLAALAKQGYILELIGELVRGSPSI